MPNYDDYKHFWFILTKKGLIFVANQIVTDETVQEFFNFLKTRLNNIGDLSGLKTTAKNNIVAAVNEILANAGTLSSLKTTTKDSIANAINELVERTQILTYNNAWAHNSVYRGKNLGTALTAEQSAAIRNGTFEDIYPGDYWTTPIPAYSWTDSDGKVHNEPAQGTRRWYVMGLDYFYKNYIHIKFTSHHAVVVPESTQLTITGATMYATETTAGGYAGSEVFTKHLKKWEELLKAIFGDDHLLRYSMSVCNAVTDGKESGWITVSNRICDLLTRSMVCVSKPNALFTPLPGFFFNPHEITGGWAYAWLQDAYDSKDFYVLNNTGGITHYHAVNSEGYGYIRPFFLLH